MAVPLRQWRHWQYLSMLWVAFAIFAPLIGLNQFD
jgi:hypothetical protein